MRWTIDECPDANGFFTIRPADGTGCGDTGTQPIATVYSDDHAPIVAAAPDMLAALRIAREALLYAAAKVLDKPDWQPGEYVHLMQAKEHADRAIAKAEGAA